MQVGIDALKVSKAECGKLNCDETQTNLHRRRSFIAKSCCLSVFKQLQAQQRSKQLLYNAHVSMQKRLKNLSVFCFEHIRCPQCVLLFRWPANFFTCNICFTSVRVTCIWHNLQMDRDSGCEWSSRRVNICISNSFLYASMNRQTVTRKVWFKRETFDFWWWQNTECLSIRQNDVKQ